MRPSPLNTDLDRLANLYFGTLRKTKLKKRVTLRETFSEIVIRFNFFIGYQGS